MKKILSMTMMVLAFGMMISAVNAATIVGNVVSHCAIADLNGNTKPEVLYLGVDAEGVPTIMAIDVDTETANKNYQVFTSAWTPKQIFTMSDMSTPADGIKEIAVRAKNASTGHEAVKIIDSMTGVLIKEIILK